MPHPLHHINLCAFRQEQKTKDRLLVERLERLRIEIGVDKKIWSEKLRLTERQYEQFISGKKPLTALALIRVAEELSLDPEALSTGKIDYTAVLQRHLGNKSYLSPEFSVVASSRKFTVVNTLNYVEKFRGHHLRVAANRKFQVHEDFWKDWKNPDSEKVNILFVTELWAFLRGRGLTAPDFRAIGFNSVGVHRETHIGKVLSSFEKPFDAYECLFSDFVQNFEQNHHYKIIRLTRSHCVVESRSNREVADALRLRDVGSIEGCQFRTGLLRSIPIFLGLPAADVHESLCIHRGDSVCRFICDFSSPKPTMLI